MTKTDVLQKLNCDEIESLKNFYENYKDDVPHVFSFLKTALKWNKTHPEYITVFAVDGKWQEDGTFIALLTYYCYDIFLYSLEKSGEKLIRGLTETKQIKWSQHEVLFYAVHQDLKDIVFKAVNALNIVYQSKATTNMWQVMADKALQFDTNYGNDDFYMDSVKPEHAEIINSVWPNVYDTSLPYLRTFIELNYGVGIYEKSTNKLVSWILCSALGQLGVLQTLDGYFKKGLGSAVTRKLSQMIAQNGDHPIGTVSDGNTASETMFTKLGFQKRYQCIYIRLYKATS